MKRPTDSAAQDLELRSKKLEESLQRVKPKISVLTRELSALGKLLKELELDASELFSIAERTQQEAVATEMERLLVSIRKPKSELSSREKGQICLTLSERFGLTEGEIAGATGYSVKQIQNFKSMLGTFPKSIADLIEDGRVKITTAFEEMRAFPHDGEKHLLEAWEIARSEGRSKFTEADLNKIRPARS